MKAIMKLSGYLSCVGVLLFSSVAGATTYNLTAQGLSKNFDDAVDGTYNDAYFTTIATNNPLTTDIPQGSSGSGVFESFERLSRQGNGTTAQGYNTNANGVLDNKGGGFTHDLLLRQIPVSTSLLNGNFTGAHYEFFMDAQESDMALTLESLQIFVTRDGGQSSTSFSLDGMLQLTDSRLVWSLDGFDPDTGLLVGADNSVNLFSTNGQGRPELGVYILKSYFDAAISYMVTNNGWSVNDDIYVVLYSSFSGTDSSFVEWDTKQTIPEPATVLPLACILFAAMLMRRRCSKNMEELPALA